MDSNLCRNERFMIDMTMMGTELSISIKNFKAGIESQLSPQQQWSFIENPAGGSVMHIY